MENIITVKNNECFIDSDALAVISDNEHRAVTKLIRNHMEDLEFFGVITRSVLKPSDKGGRPKTVYWLNEQQATLLSTFMMNSEKVRLFKKRLVGEFFRQREIISDLIAQKKSPDWQNVRKDRKTVYFQKTDIIKRFVDYSTEQGSKSAKMYYMNFAKMENSALFFFEQKYKNLREVMTIKQLMQVATADQVIEKAIQEGMDKEMFYKDIYQLAKERIMDFAEIIGKSPILQLSEK